MSQRPGKRRVAVNKQGAATQALQPQDLASIHEMERSEGIPAALRLAQTQLNRVGRHPALLQLIGQFLLLMSRDAEALPWLEEACAAQPDDVDAWNQRALVLSHLGRHDEAHDAYLQTVRLAPGIAALFVNIGGNLNHADRPGEAEVWLHKGLLLAPDSPELKTNLAIALIQQGRAREATVLVDAVLRTGYRPVELLEAKATLLHTAGRYIEAETLVRQLLSHRPDSATLIRLLAIIVGSLGRADEQLALTRQVLAIDPLDGDARSNLLFALNYSADSDGPSLLAEARQYGEVLHAKLAKRGLHPYTAWNCEAQPVRLRVGLVSGDFRSHPVGYFLDDVIPAITDSGIELVAYSNLIVEDELTQRMRPHFAAWRSIVGLDDVHVARLIHADRIHVLVDLAGHSARHRLPVFALKPAPVQASWLGYLGSTGVAEIDWVIGDRYIAPEHEPSHLVEKVWRMPDSYVHLSVPDQPVVLEGSPAARQGYITFGNFNNMAKMTDTVVALWARVMHAVVGSRLLLKSAQFKEAAVVQHTLARYAAHGITADRLMLEGPSPRVELLAAYNRVDIALDPFPYTGGTTTLEALWMSVPVLTLRGDRFMSRMGETLMRNAGLHDWIADDGDHLVHLAALHAGDRQTLGRMRNGALRAQVLASPLMDTARFADDVEQMLWGMWRHRAAKF